MRLTAATSSISCASRCPYLVAKFPTIFRLIGPGNPFAICRRIWSVVVNSLYRITFVGPCAHVAIKVFETMKPTRTHFNAASTVIFVGFICFAIAATDHLLVYSVFLGIAIWFAAVGLAHTSTGFRQTSCQTTRKNIFCRAAPAHTNPISGTTGGCFGGATYNRPVTELFASQIFFKLGRPEPIRASSGASGLPSKGKTGKVGHVTGLTNGAPPQDTLSHGIQYTYMEQ